MSKYIFVAKGAGGSILYVSYVLVFYPSFGRMMRPVVAKGVDGELHIIDYKLGGPWMGQHWASWTSKVLHNSSTIVAS
jgi:hypothetical protein